MNNLELDQKLIKLTKERAVLSSRYDELDEQIFDVTEERDNVERRMDTLDLRIYDIKKQLLQSRVKDINVFTDDPFTNDFIRASYFAAKEDDLPASFYYINLTENELIACNGGQIAVIIKSDCIPDNLKNTRIKWDARSGFEEHVDRKVSAINIKKLLEVMADTELIVSDCTAGTLTDLVQVYPSGKLDYAVKLNTAKARMTVNKEYLDTALMVMGDEVFDICCKGGLTPIIFKSDRITATAMPIHEPE